MSTKIFKNLDRRNPFEKAILIAFDEEADEFSVEAFNMIQLDDTHLELSVDTLDDPMYYGYHFSATITLQRDVAIIDIYSTCADPGVLLVDLTAETCEFFER